MDERRQPDRVNTYLQKALVITWRIVRSILAVIISLMFLTAGLLWGYDYVMGKYIKPVDEGDSTPVLVEIQKGSSVGTIATVLEDAHVIRNKQVFQLYVDINGYGSDMKAGTYVMTRQMSIEEIMEKLKKGGTAAQVMTVTIMEGSTIESMAQSLVDQGALTDTTKFLELCNDLDEFKSYTFLPTQEQAGNRKYALEGYLFPDKYEIYTNSSPETIMIKMLNRFEVVMDEKYMTRAQELNMTVDDVIILASIIEKEAKTNDFAKVSAVFHNRLDRGMRLESDATVQYVTGIKKLNMTPEDVAVDSLYNTYHNDGLPPGPICQPSKKAIEAALYPDEEYVNDGYLYFLVKDPATGELEFNIKYEDHLAAREKYLPLWDASDAAKASQTP